MPTMRSADLAARFRERFGVEVLPPDEAGKTIVDRIIFDELVRGEVREESKARISARRRCAARQQGAEGVILGCTEIFMLIGQADLPGFPVFDTTALHVEAAVKFAVGDL